MTISVDAPRGLAYDRDVSLSDSLPEGACDEARNWLDQHNDRETALSACTNVGWLAWLCDRVDPEAAATALRAYEEAIDPAWRAYEEAIAPAWRAYQEAIDPAQRAYQEALRVAIRGSDWWGR